MIPTAKLRWFDTRLRGEAGKDYPSAISGGDYRTLVLQQWWESGYEGESGEWRDIPIAREE